MGRRKGGAGHAADPPPRGRAALTPARPVPGIRELLSAPGSRAPRGHLHPGTPPPHTRAPRFALLGCQLERPPPPQSLRAPPRPRLALRSGEHLVSGVWGSGGCAVRSRGPPISFQASRMGEAGRPSPLRPEGVSAWGCCPGSPFTSFPFFFSSQKGLGLVTRPSHRCPPYPHAWSLPAAATPLPPPILLEQAFIKHPLYAGPPDTHLLSSLHI